jgi:predicted AlkP superfamily phosphohydrolase/phosphomutase
MGAKLAGQLGAFDWTKTRVFFGFHSDLWLNLEGREPNGNVKDADRDGLIAELSENLLGITDPATGAPVIAAVHKREDIYSGPAIDLAPDLICDTWSAGYRVAPARDPHGDVVVPPAALAGVDASWSSDHRPVGIFVAAGPNVAPGTTNEFSLQDLAPTALALLNQPIPSDLDGRPATEALTPAFLERNPIQASGTSTTRTAEAAYSEAEAAAVAEHLKDLGYIE